MPVSVVVGDHRRHVEFAAVLRGHREQRVAAGARVHAARVRDHADVARDQRVERLLDLRDEVARVPGLRIAGALLLHDGHRDLGEEVERHVVHRALLDLAPESAEVVAPVAAGVGNANGLGLGWGFRLVDEVLLYAAAAGRPDEEGPGAAEGSKRAAADANRRAEGGQRASKALSGPESGPAK